MAQTLEESARRAGYYQWSESRLFEILGGWVTSTPEPELRLALDRHSRHAAWRAREWWDRLPVLADVDRPALCVPPGPSAAAAADRLAALEGSGPRAAAAYRVILPRLWSAYHRYGEALGAAGLVADGSTLRTLEIVARDLAGDWREGELVCQQVLVAPEVIRAAADAVGALEEFLVGAPPAAS